jgi:hypothetical protein
MAGGRPCIVQREHDREAPRQRNECPEVKVAIGIRELSMEVVAVNHLGTVGKQVGNMSGSRKTEVFDSQLPVDPMGGGSEVAEHSTKHAWAAGARIDGIGE